MTGKLVREKVSKWHFLQSIRKCFEPLRSRKVRKSEKINEKKAKKVYEKNLTKKWRKEKSQGKLWLGAKRVIERQVKKDAITRSRIGDSRLIKHNKFNMEGLRH